MSDTRDNVIMITQLSFKSNTPESTFSRGAADVRSAAALMWEADSQIEKPKSWNLKPY